MSSVLQVALIAAATALPGAGSDAPDRSAWLADVARSIESAAYHATCSGPWAEADETICKAVWPKSQLPELAGLLLTTGYYESRLLKRIAAGRCRRDECDATKLPDGRVWHRARGLYQIQNSGLLPSGEWARLAGVREVPMHRSAYAAARILAASRARCARFGGSDAFVATLSGYGTGMSCSWRGAKPRADMAKRIAAKIRDAYNTTPNI